jgi:hypothetical protein
LHVCMNISGFRHHKENRLKNSRRLFSLDNYWCLYSTWFEKREANPIKYCVYSTRRTASVISRADIPGWRRLSLSLSTCLSQNLVRPQTAFVFMGTTYERKNGSMFWSQFSAIFDNFQWKNWRFSQKPMLW